MVFFSEGDKSYNFNQISVATGLVNFHPKIQIYGVCFVSPYLIALLVKMFGGKMPVVRVLLRLLS